MRLQFNLKVLTNIASLFCLALVASSICLSCVSISSHLKLTHRSTSEVPYDAFAFVMVKHSIYPDECLPSEKFEECSDIIKMLPPVRSSGSGSGLLVWAKKKPVFLTAAHVCLVDSPVMYEAQGVKFTLKAEADIRIRGTSGEVLSTKIIKINEEKDLCALEVPKMTSAPVRVSHKKPKIGDKVYALSAPYGISKPTINLVFSGYYSGKDERWHFYTIPTRPGSSGSIVLNKNYRAVGMLNAAFVDIEHIGLGAGHEDIVTFLESIPD